jgi:RNAse (barnase) inhibitor barstar
MTKDFLGKNKYTISSLEIAYIPELRNIFFIEVFSMRSSLIRLLGALWKTITTTVLCDLEAVFLKQESMLVCTLKLVKEAL